MGTTLTRPKCCRTWEQRNRISSLQMLISWHDWVAGLVIFDFFATSAHTHSTVYHYASSKVQKVSCILFPLFVLSVRPILFVVHNKASLPSFRGHHTLHSTEKRS